MCSSFETFVLRHSKNSSFLCNMENKQNAGFQGTTNYVATRELQTAVNAAVALQRPLLIKGEQGTGKTLLASIKDLRA